jgi:hypothetical protein
VLVLAIAAGCRGRESRTSERNAVNEPTIQSVLERESPAIMALPGVVAVGEGRTADGKPCIRVYVEDLTPERRARIPRTLGPYPVEVEDSGGPIRALPDSAAPR